MAQWTPHCALVRQGLVLFFSDLPWTKPQLNVFWWVGNGAFTRAQHMAVTADNRGP